MQLVLIIYTASVAIFLFPKISDLDNKISKYLVMHNPFSFREKPLVFLQIIKETNISQPKLTSSFNFNSQKFCLEKVKFWYSCKLKQQHQDTSQEVTANHAKQSNSKNSQLTRILFFLLCVVPEFVTMIEQNLHANDFSKGPFDNNGHYGFIVTRDFLPDRCHIFPPG